ncbi:Rv3235 family protein [Aquipuribacter nitratireducens]|uniref:Rv3235 family protein n=1 Tax=Aquipuribacter nitratireducens TaxID=650104 RepID=A0ABW0GNC2_9MICO
MTTATIAAAPAPAVPAWRPAPVAPCAGRPAGPDGPDGPVEPVEPRRPHVHDVPEPARARWSPRAVRASRAPSRATHVPLPIFRSLVDETDTAGVGRDGDGASPDGGHEGRGAAARDCPDDLVRRLVQAVVDVVRGHRPPSQLLRWTTPEVYAELRQRVLLEHAATGRGAATAVARRPVVRSVRSAPAGSRALEVSAVVLDGVRARAVAARLDGSDGRWRLVALELG